MVLSKEDKTFIRTRFSHLLFILGVSVVLFLMLLIIMYLNFLANSIWVLIIIIEVITTAYVFYFILYKSVNYLKGSRKKEGVDKN